MTKSFKDLLAWQRAYEFTLLVYKYTSDFPDFEKFGLRSQFTRAAVSIQANIAEGYKKLSKNDKLRFINIAQGSIEECRSYIYLSRDLNYISILDSEVLEQTLDKASYLINAYVKSIVNNKALDAGSVVS